jgi:CBS domain-containing protein
MTDEFQEVTDMDEMLVKDIMVPLMEYAIVSNEASLYDALAALEEAQKNFDKKIYKHRAVLVLDKSGRVVGEISQNDVLRALEPKYEKLGGKKNSFSRYGFSKTYMGQNYDQFDLWSIPLKKMIKKASEYNVKSIMYKFDGGEFIDANATITEAIHLLVVGNHQSLPVKTKNDIVGILRLTDVFHEVYRVLVEIDEN